MRTEPGDGDAETSRVAAAQADGAPAEAPAAPADASPVTPAGTGPATSSSPAARPTGLGMSGSAPLSWRPARFVAQRLLLKPLVWSVTSVTVTGREHLEGLDGAFVVAANHSSHLDAPLVLCSLPWRTGTRVAVGAAADYFFDARWRAAVTGLVFNAFPVDRQGGRGRRGHSTELLDDGIPLLVFPEGTRSRDGQMHRFKPGAAALALSRGVPVLPIGLRGAYDAMPRGRNWPLPGRPQIEVAFGHPLRAGDGESAVAFTTRIRASVEQLVAPRAADDVEHGWRAS